jgi:tetratricopeptide (TPR) repeat protein
MNPIPGRGLRMFELPESLVERLKRRQAALVTGLGCGELAGAPGWAALVEWLAARVPNDSDRTAALKLAQVGRIGDAVALVRAALGPKALPDAIREAYPDGTLVPDAIEVAAGLPWRAVVTTGFDDMWERALASEKGDGRPPHVLVGTDAAGAPRRNGQGALLMHLFGRAGLPDSLCLGPGDAHDRLTPSGGLVWLEELRRRRSLVLIGFRASDPDLDWLTSWMSVVPSTDAPHFLFLDVSREADPEGEARLVALRTGLNVIPCQGGTAEAVEILAELSANIGADVASFDADVDIEEWLSRWARDPGDPEPREVLARAATALRFEQEWERLIELLLGRFDLQEDREEQLATLREAAMIYRGPLAAPGRALTTGLAALRLMPLDDELWDQLRSDAAAAGAWDDLYSDGAEAAQTFGTTPKGARIWREIARIARDQLNRPEAAVVAYLDALSGEPGHAQTRDELLDLLRRLERWTDLVSALRAGAAETKDPVRASKFLLEAADILEERVGDPGGAISAFEALLAIDADSEPAWSALERLYQAQSRWSDLVALLDSRARRVPPADAAPLRRRRAEILADNLGETDAAAAELEALIAADPGDRAALGLLDQIYEKAERHDDHLVVLQRLVHTASETAERLGLLRRLAMLWESRPGGLDTTADALEHILRLEARDPDAFAALTRVYRQARRPIALADVLTRQIDLTEDVEARIPLQLALAETYEQELMDPAKAYDAYAAAEKGGDRREETFEALVRLGERLERWDVCADALQKWADVSTDTEMQAELLLQAGLLLVNQLHDDSRAELQLTRILTIAPAHTGALIALGGICRSRGDFEPAAKMLLDAAEHLVAPTEKAELLTDVATIYQDQLGNEDRAVELYARALGAEPELVRAGERLADITFRRKQWAEAEPILDMLARKLDAGDAAKIATVQLRRAIVSRQLGKPDRALEYFAEAHRLAAESLPVLSGYADFRFQRSEWTEARDLYASILNLHQAALSAPELLNVTMRLGRCEAELGQVQAAIEWYQKAQALDPAHRPAIEALCALHTSQGDWTALIRAKRALKAIAVPEEQAPLLEEIGDLYSERLHEVLQAVAAFQAALGVEPARRSTLHKLLDVYTKDKDWRPAAETLVRLAEIEADPGVRAKSLYAAGLIKRDELGHFAEAADLLERALDQAPDMIQAFDALEKVHRSQSAWPELARSYRRMIKRLPAEGQDELRTRLWSQLGELAVRRLRNLEVAVAAYEVAVSLDPADIGHQEQLANLYVQSGPSARDKAIAAHQHLIARNPNRLASYRTLARLYSESGDFDKHWCVAATLSFLGKADANLEATYQRHRSPELRLAKRRFNEEIWQRITHPDEDRMLDALFVLAGAYLAAPAARTHLAVGLRRKRRVDLATDVHVPVRALVKIAETMDLATPDVFLMEGEGEETTILNLQEKGILTPALVLGRSTLRRRDDFELVFDLSKRMAFMRPERFLRCALPTAAVLDVALRVVLALGGCPVGPDAEKGEVARLTELLRRTVSPQAIEQLTFVAPKFVAARGDKIDFDKWIVATDLSAARAALVMTGDLWAAARVIASEPASQTPLAVKERMKDLIAFSVSEEYFICRRLLGLDVHYAV